VTEWHGPLSRIKKGVEFQDRLAFTWQAVLIVLFNGRFLMRQICEVRRDVIQRIMTRMHLPAGKTDLNRDPHYRCAICLARSAEHER
jgi:hypothetical protein